MADEKHIVEKKDSPIFFSKKKLQEIKPSDIRQMAEYHDELSE